MRLREVGVSIKEVLSPIDFRNTKDANEWSQSALQKRPERPIFFERFAQEIEGHPAIKKVLELGSGPGFLAEHLLSRLSTIEYVALDFSAAMHELARIRLGEISRRVTFIEQCFKADRWSMGLGKFDCVVTNQAVHELRHKSYASNLHRVVREVLNEGGMYLVNDHFAGSDGMSNGELFMTQKEQQEALFVAGFSEVSELLTRSKMSLLRAIK
jgi:SAM-dependent methyltransferase